jgi:ankyrin repeat protein
LGGNLEKVELLLRYGANPNQPLTNGSLPLFLARGQRDLCLALVKAGADPNSQSLGFRPIHHAVALGNKEFFSALVELGAEPTMQPGDVESPICYAATSRSIEIARMLIELGADCNAASRTFRSPVAAAIQVGHEEMALELINQGCDVGRLHFYPELMPFVLHYNQLKIGRLLLDRGVDPNEPMRGGAIYHQPLHYAVLNSDEDMVRLLLDYGADVNLVDGQLNTAIDHVVHALQFPGSEPLIPKARLLLEAGGESSRLTMYQVEQILADCENI